MFILFRRLHLLSVHLNPVAFTLSAVGRIAATDECGTNYSIPVMNLIVPRLGKAPGVLSPTIIQFACFTVPD